jgi:hypothetical protein
MNLTLRVLAVALLEESLIQSPSGTGYKWDLKLPPVEFLQIRLNWTSKDLTHYLVMDLPDDIDDAACMQKMKEVKY